MKLFYLLIISFSLGGCASAFFQPSREMGVSPAFFELDYETRRIKTDDNLTLFSWLLKAQNPKATIVYFHGNAGNISSFLPSVYWLPSRGFSVLTVDFRGYGASGGKEPTIEGAIADAVYAIKYAIADANISRAPIVVFGQSLGGAIAIRAAAECGCRDKLAAIVTEGAFSSYETEAKEVAKRASFLGYAALPFLGGIVDRGLDPIENIAALEGLPILIIHGDRDPIVSFSHAHALFDAAHEPKRLKIVFGGAHIDNFAGDKTRRDQFAEMLESLIAKDR